MKNLIFLFGVLAILLVFGIYSLISKNTYKQQQAKPIPTIQISQNTLKTKTDSEGQVTVRVTPKNIKERGWEFEIVMDTHSVTLDQDMVAVSKLIDDREIEYKPTLWKEDGPGSHHRKGVLKFEGIVPKPSSIRLMIIGIGGVERNFTWDL